MRTVSELVSTAVQNIKGNIETFTVLALLISLISTLQMYFVPESTVFDLAAIGQGVLVGLVVLVVSMFLYVYTLYVIVEKSGATHEKAMTYTSQRFVSFVWVQILTTIVIILGFVLLIIPGVLAIFFLLFTPFVFVTEGANGLQALKGSYRYIKGNFGTVLSKVLVLLVLCIPYFIMPKELYVLDGMSKVAVYFVVFALLQYLYFGAIAYLYELFLDVRAKSNAVAQQPVPVAGTPAPSQTPTV